MNISTKYQDVCRSCYWYLSSDPLAPCIFCHRRHTSDKSGSPSINRTFKSSLFTIIFGKKADLLELYNALNNSDYTDSNQLTVTTLHNAIYMSMKNDISFLLGSTMNLYEHQSTYNPNMPLRGFLYFAQLYEKLIISRNINIYSTKLQKIPTPRYIVFYNGTSLQPDKIILRLSDAFETANGCLECEVTMLNINYGRNKELMEKCHRLEEYSIFVDRVRHHTANRNDLSSAIHAAIDECIQKDILKDILTQSKAEVHDMVLTTFNRELYENELKEDAYMEGLAEGKIAGIAEGKAAGIVEGKHQQLDELIQKKLAKGKSIETIADELEESVEFIKKQCERLL